MHVLICDDDPSTRFVIKRLLTQNLGCTTSECADGVEALQCLDKEEVDLVVLDIEMPLIDGVEVLEAIRTSAQLKSLPVLMLSKERREDVVAKLVRLGIEGYILKPPRTEKVLAALERLRGTLTTRTKAARGGNVQSVRLGPDCPALLVDGNLDYRHFFMTQGAKQGPIIEAESGAAALVRFKLNPVRLVFIGSEIGVLGPDLLVPKLRALSGSIPVRIVGIVDSNDPAGARGVHFDDVMFRTYVPEKFRAELRRFTRVPGPMAAVTSLAGDLTNGMTSAAQQVFGMMLDTELEPLSDLNEPTPMMAAVSEMTIQGRYLVHVGIRTTVPSIQHIAARMLGMEVPQLEEEDYVSTAAELANLVSGRLKAHFEEKNVPCDCGLPQLEREPAVWSAESVGDDGLVVRFKVATVQATVVMSAVVTDRLADPAASAA